MELVDDSSSGLYTGVGGCWSTASVPLEALTWCGTAIELRIQGGVVIHFELAVKLETAFFGENIHP